MRDRDSVWERSERNTISKKEKKICLNTNTHKELKKLSIHDEENEKNEESMSDREGVLTRHTREKKHTQKMKQKIKNTRHTLHTHTHKILTYEFSFNGPISMFKW